MSVRCMPALADEKWECLCLSFLIVPYADLSPEQFWHKIGKGSFGSVYRGEYLSLEVAIKEVLPVSQRSWSNFPSVHTDLLELS